MVNLTRSQINTLRARGYPLKGENWLWAEPSDMTRPEMRVIKVVEGDTLAIVHLPADLLKEILS